MQKADIWSCGIILYAMLFGKHPFDVEDRLFIRKLVLARYSIPAVSLPLAFLIACSGPVLAERLFCQGSFLLPLHKETAWLS